MSSLPGAISPPNPPAQPVLRVGTITADLARADVATVLLFDGGDPIELPYSAGYVPKPGDAVNVLCIGAGNTMQGLILGGASGRSGNLVANPDFRIHPAPSVSSSAPPYLWRQHVLSGATAILGTYLHTDYQRALMFFGMLSGAASDNIAYGAAIPVIGGETLNFNSDTHVTSATTTVAVSLRVAWYSSAPLSWDGALSEVTIASDSGTAPYKSWLTGTATAPEAATYVRVGVRSNFAGGGAGYTMLVGLVEAHR